LAEASGFSQPEVEKLCDLKPVARAAPARASRPAPSLFRPLLRLLLQKPELAVRLPLEALPDDSGEARAVMNLCKVILSMGDPVPGYASLLERLRGGEDETVLREAAAELMQQPFAEGDVDDEFDGAVVRLVEGQKKRAFARLQEKVGRLGVAGLSSEEKQEYLQALGMRK
jgi:DNA primase